MEIKTKYSKGQKLWTLSYNKVISGNITKIEIEYYGNENDRIKYICPGEFERVEAEVFESKQDLLNSL